MSAILKLGLKLFTASAVFLAAVLALVYFIDAASQGAIRRWIFDGPSRDQQNPLLYVHVIWNVEDLVGLLFVYFVLCTILGWAWISIKAKTK